jgi:hypothetical protein
MIYRLSVDTILFSGTIVYFYSHALNGFAHGEGGLNECSN